MLQMLLLAAAISMPPTPAQYYTRALQTMNALPQPAQLTYNLDLEISGAGASTACWHDSQQQYTVLEVGWGRAMKHDLHLGGRYTLATDSGALRLQDGTYCRARASLLKPVWPAVHDWMRYGFDGPPPSAKTQPQPVQPVMQNIPTIASVTAVSPGAYRISDAGSALCPGGTAGHALHLVARSDPDAHPLTDVIVETSTMRFCSMRFRLISATVAGTGAKGDAVLDFGENAGFWTVTHSDTVLSLRMLGISLKHFSLDVSYSDFAYIPQK